MEECTLIILDEGLEPRAVAAASVCCKQGPIPLAPAE